MIRVKICGITRLKDARAAIAAGADALGFVFFQGSKRFIAPEQAAAIIAKLPPLVTMVGLFVNATVDEIDRVATLCRLDCIQLHGDEPPEACLGLPARVIKAVRVGAEEDLLGLERYPVSSLLLDAKVAGHYGGSGARFDWSLLAGHAFHVPLILAGGLTPETVAEAVTVVRPYAVDVSSGVESAPGIKDADKVAAFIHNARSAAVHGTSFSL